MTEIALVFTFVIFLVIGVVLAFKETIFRVDQLDDRVRKLEERRREEDFDMGKIIQEEMMAHAKRRRSEGWEGK